jgi:hypothetical protein
MEELDEEGMPGRARSRAVLVEEEEEDEQRGGSKDLRGAKGWEERDTAKGGASKSVSGSE